MAPLTLQRVDVAKWEQMAHIQTLCVRRSPFPTQDEVSLTPLSLGLNIIKSDGRFSWCKINSTMHLESQRALHFLNAGNRSHQMRTCTLASQEKTDPMGRCPISLRVLSHST